MTENELSKEIVNACYRIHTRLGPGLLESVYETTLAHELHKRGIKALHQQPMPVVYDTIRMGIGFRVDLIVGDKVIVEIKSIDAIAPVHRKQLLTYLRLADKRLGLLVNFNVELIKDGISRVVNNLQARVWVRIWVHAKARRKEKPEAQTSLWRID
ncbi:MAG: GxxExxY protein [Pyrinomonadaceae bacterium]